MRVRSADSSQLAAALSRENLKTTQRDEHVLFVTGTTSERVGEIAFASGVPVHELVTEGSSLEEIFLELTTETQS